MNAKVDRRLGGWSRWQKRALLYGLGIGIIALLICRPGCLSFLPGCASLSGSRPLRLLDLKIGDAMHSRMAPELRTSQQGVCAVGITDEDAAGMPASLTRKSYADLVHELREAGAKVIALDLVFADEQRDDGVLAMEMRRAGNVVLARRGDMPDTAAGPRILFGGVPAGGSEKQESPLRFADGSFRIQLLKAAPQIYEAARAIGHAQLFYDNDRVVRRVPAAVNGPGTPTHYLPLAVVCAMLGEGLDPAADARLEERSLRYGQTRIPLDASGCIPISFVPLERLIERHSREISRTEAVAGMPRQAAVQFFSYSDVMEGRAPRSVIKDAIVLVGPCYNDARHEIHLTPEKEQYGVLIQATLLDAVLNRRFITEASEGWIMFVMVLLSALVGAVCFTVRFRVSGYTAVAGGVAAFAFGAALVLAVTAWFSGYGVTIEASPYLLMLGLNLGAGVAVNSARTARDARRRDMEMDVLLLAGRRNVTELPEQDTPRASVIPGASQMAISASLSMRSPEIVAETLCQGIPCQGCMLFSIPEGNSLSFDRSVYHAFTASYPRAEVERIAVRFAWETLKHGRPITHSRRHRDWLFHDANPIFLNLMGVPIVARGQPLAVVVMFNKRATENSPEREFTEDHLRLVSALRYQAAALLENARRYQLEYAMFDGFARSLAKAVDFRDNYTRGHSERVAELSAGIAQELGLSEEEVEIVQRAATLHDLGKIGVNDGVLRKPGRLSDGEFSMIRAHAANGFEILKAAPSFEALLPGIRHHHERYDGTGYPDGLSGEAIPLIARIVAAADAYDAMTSNRPYRKALPETKAREELRAGSGTQFDPQVVEALLRHLDKRGMDESAEVTQTAQVLAMMEAAEGDIPPADAQPAAVPPQR